MKFAVALQRALPSARGFEQWMYVGEDAAWRLAAERGALAGLPRAPTGEVVARYADELRQPFLDWVGEMSSRDGSFEWWASQTAAKNPYTFLYARLCALGAALELLRGDGPPTLVVCSTNALAEELVAAGGKPLVRATAPARSRLLEAGWRALQVWAATVPEPVRSFPARAGDAARRALDWAPAHRRQTLREIGAEPLVDFGGPGTALLATWLDDRNFDATRYVDPHFGPLPDMLREAGQRIAYLPRVLPAMPFKDAAQQLIATGEAAAFPDFYVSGEDWRRAHRAARSWRPPVNESDKVHGVPAFRLAIEHAWQERFAHAEALTYEPLVRALAARGVKPERIFLTWEGHAWEQAFTWAVHEHLPETTIVGYDNVNFSRLALSLYPARSEIGRRPLPDRIVTNGPLFAEILEREGFPIDDMRVGCALRHTYLWDRNDTGGRAPGPRPRILVATSIDLAQSIEQIETALEAFAAEDAYEVAIKLHPSVDGGKVRDAVVARIGSNARFVDDPIDRLLGHADVMLYTYSVVPYEALRLGVPAVFVRSESFLDLDQLEPFPSLRWEARGPKALRETVQEILAMPDRERKRWEGAALEAVRRALAPRDSSCVSAFLS